MRLRWSLRLCFLVLFTGPIIMEFNKYNFKTGSYDTIYTFKNYFAAVFLTINFQFLAISGIQTHLKLFPNRY